MLFIPIPIAWQRRMFFTFVIFSCSFSFPVGQDGTQNYKKIPCWDRSGRGHFIFGQKGQSNFGKRGQAPAAQGVTRARFFHKQLKGAVYPAITFSFGGGLNSRSNEFLQLFGKYSSRMNASVTLSMPILDWGKNRLNYRNKLANMNKRELEYKARLSSIKSGCHHDIEMLSRLLQEIETEDELIDLLRLRMATLKYNAEYGRIEMSEISKVRSSLIQSQLQNIYRLKNILSIIYKYRKNALIDIRTGSTFL